MRLDSTTRRWLRFNAVGALGMAIQLATLAALIRVWRMPTLPATVVAVEAAVVHNFCWHQRWTWRDRPVPTPAGVVSRFIHFQALNGLISLAGNLAVMALVTRALPIDPVAANVLAIAVCSVATYLASDLLVFANGPGRPLPAPDAPPE